MRWWDASVVYAGLRKFHTGKGFDPDSQDVARHLEQPLYKLSPDEDAPFAHISNGEAETEGGSTATTEDEDEDEDGPTSEDVTGKVSDVKPEREHSTMATNEDEDGDGSAPEDVDGEILEVGAESEGSSPATNEDEDRDEFTPQEKCASLHSVPDVELSWSWEVVMFVKLGLILVLGFGSLCEYWRAVLSQRDI
ncbi:hypothetical protein B0H11DRAFT_2015954 [Mycena galericulata]|nr:hypothetical protein B0H11DRAFT_2015954 [Mycena galericulata]